VLASDGRLSQVFLNLLINAADAIEEGDVEGNEIRVRTWLEEDGVYAEVRDTGAGIPREHLERLFEPFFTTKEVGRGSGLGLAICRQIVEGFGGDIRAESAPGEGSRFVVRLPRHGGATEWRRKEPTPAATAAPARALGRVLVVDDEQPIRTAVTRLLRGHEVVAVGSGEEAQALLREDRRFDVIVCDVMMPRMSGMELHMWLAAVDAEAARRVVFVTGGAFTPRSGDYLARSGLPVVEKPFDGKALRALVDEMVAAARAAKRGG
jgi:CheY-like chemotaxis protein